MAHYGFGAGRFIEVDTPQLGRDKNTLGDMINAMQKNLEDLYRMVEEMDAMWDGVANEAFNKVFASDRELFTIICDDARALADSIAFAKAEYERCEAQVNEAIDAI